MKKTFCLICLIPVFLSLFSFAARAEEVDGSLEQVMNETEYESIFEAIPEESVALLEEYGIDLSEDVAAPDLSQVVGMIFSLFHAVLAEHLPVLTVGMILILVFKLISSVCVGNHRLMESLGYLAIISSGVYSFSVIERVLTSLTQVSEQTSSFLTAALPVISAVQIWAGAQNGASVLATTLPMILTVLSFLVSSVFYPLCWFCYAASLSGFFREKISLRPLVSSIKKICTRGVEILAGLSVGVFCVQRAAAASADTVARKGVHFALVQMLPMAGGVLTDGIETIYACGRSLCGKVGVISVLAVAALFATPCILGFLLVSFYSVLSSAGSVFGVPLLTDFFADVRDTFAMMTSFSVCSLIVVASAILLLTGG